MLLRPQLNVRYAAEYPMPKIVQSETIKTPRIAIQYTSQSSQEQVKINLLNEIKLEIPQEVIHDRGMSYKGVDGKYNLTKDNQEKVNQFLRKLQSDNADFVITKNTYEQETEKSERQNAYHRNGGKDIKGDWNDSIESEDSSSSSSSDSQTSDTQPSDEEKDDDFNRFDSGFASAALQTVRRETIRMEAQIEDNEFAIPMTHAYGDIDLEPEITPKFNSENNTFGQNTPSSQSPESAKSKRAKFMSDSMKSASGILGKGEQDENIVKTELIEKEGKSSYKILHGFWMQGDFYILVTYDSQSKGYFLEMFQYDCLDKKGTRFNQVDKMKLLDSKESVKFSINDGEHRKYVSIFVEIKSYQTRKLNQVLIYILNSESFRVREDTRFTLGLTEPYQLSNGLRKIPDSDIPKLDQGFSGKALQQFVYTQYDSIPMLYVYFQQSTKNKSIERKSENASQRTFLGRINSQDKIEAYQTYLFKVNTKELFTTQRHEVEELLRATTANKKVEVVNFNFLDKRIVGVFRLQKRKSIVVYYDGYIQSDTNQPGQTKKEQLQLPFKQARRCLITKFNDQQPMLVFQSKRCQTAGFVLDEGTWSKKFMIPGNKYKLTKAFGPFMVGTLLTNQTVKLLELGGKRDNSIVTEMSLGNPGQTDLQIDAFIKKSNFAVNYERNATKFTWYKFDQQRQLHHMKSNTITQVCDDFLIEFDLHEGKIIFSDLLLIEEGEVDNQLFEVTLSKSYQNGQISSFVPFINPSKTYMVLAISYGRVKNTQWLDEKFQGLILIDLEEGEIYQPAEAQPHDAKLREPFKSIVFKSDNEFLIQNSHGVFQLKIHSTGEQDTISEDNSIVHTKTQENIRARQYSYNRKKKASYTEVDNLLLNNIQYRIEVQDYKLKDHYETITMLGTRNAQILVFQASNLQIQSFDDDSIWANQAMVGSGIKNILLISSKETKDETHIRKHSQASRTQFRKLSQGNSAPKLVCETLATVEYPDGCEISNQKFGRWSSCMNPKQDKLYMLFSNQKFCWIYSFSFKDDNSFAQDCEPTLVTQRYAKAIYFLNNSQLVIQTSHGLCIFNIGTKKIDWKVKFIQSMNVEFTVSNGLVAIPRSVNGVLLEFGQADRKAFLKNTTERSGKKNWSDLNHIMFQFKDQYEPQIGGYLCIDETLVDWDSRHKLMPINYHYNDYIQTKLTKGDNIIYERYEESEFLCLAYNNDFTIWEALIRKGLLEGKVPITDSQLNRICNPYLGDNNNSLLHKLSFHQFESLKKVFENTSIVDQYGLDNKRYLFFRNFEGHSQLDMALKKYDFESFQYLIQQVIYHQNCFNSSHLIDSWLSEALKLGLDIKPLFESKIMSQKITRDNFNNANVFESFHTKPQQMTRKFKKQLVDLYYSETAYLDLFGKAFENKIDMQEVQKPGVGDRRSSKQFRDNKRKKAMESDQQNYPISYFVDYLFPSVTDKEKLKEHFLMLNEYLAKTTDLQLFNSPLIQRYIDFQWHSKQIWIFHGLLISHIVCCICIMINISILDYDNGTVGKVRRFDLIFVGVIALITIPFFEIRQMIREKLSYFTDIWNLNDLAFLVILAATIAADTLVDTSRVSQPIDTEINEQQLESEVPEPSTEVQITRICYALLAIVSFIKLLSLLRIFDNISFIIKMLFRVGEELTPFLFLFICFVGTFAFVIVALDMDKEQFEEGDPYEGLGGAGYFVYILRTSFGDFQVDPFKSMPTPLRIFMWIFWLIVIFCNTVIFLNFIIAVISDTYEQIMDSRIEQIYQKKAQLIADIQSVFGEYTSKRAHILVTRTSKMMQDDNHWTGFVSEVKKAVKHNINVQTLTQLRHSDNIAKTTDERLEELSDQVHTMQNKFIGVENIQRQLDQMNLLMRSLVIKDASTNRQSGLSDPYGDTQLQFQHLTIPDDKTLVDWKRASSANINIEKDTILNSLKKSCLKKPRNFSLQKKSNLKKRNMKKPAPSFELLD